MLDLTTIKTRIVDARQRLRSQLHGLHRRITHTRTMISPGTYVANPWLRFGAAVVVGYQLGCPEQPESKTSHARPRASLVHSLFDTAVRNLATSAIHDVVSSSTHTSGRISGFARPTIPTS